MCTFTILVAFHRHLLCTDGGHHTLTRLVKGLVWDCIAAVFSSTSLNCTTWLLRYLRPLSIPSLYTQFTAAWAINPLLCYNYILCQQVAFGRILQVLQLRQIMRSNELKLQSGKLNNLCVPKGACFSISSISGTFRFAVIAYTYTEA